MLGRDEPRLERREGDERPEEGLGRARREAARAGRHAAAEGFGAGRRVAGSAPRAGLAQPGEDLVAPLAAEEEEEEGVAVEALGEGDVDGGGVPAAGPVGAGAGDGDLVRRGGEERAAGGGEDVVGLLGEGAGEELGRGAGPLGEGLQRAVEDLLVEGADAEAKREEGAAPVADLGLDEAGPDGERGEGALGDEGAPLLEAGAAGPGGGGEPALAPAAGGRRAGGDVDEALLRASRQPPSPASTASRRERDELGELLVGQLGDPALAGADDGAGELLLLVDHPVDPFLQRAAADELVDLHVPRLADAEGAVGRLVLDRRVPPAVEVEDVRGAGEVEARAARLQREDEEERRVVVLLEAADHLGAREARDAAVEEEDLLVELVAQRRGRGGAPSR